MNKIYKIIIILAVFLLGILGGYIIPRKSLNNYTCEIYKGQFDDVTYIEPNYELLIGKNKDQYFMDVTLNFKDNGILFSDDKAYMLINLNGLIPYSILEAEDVIEIPLENGTLPKSFSVLLIEDNYVFDKESKQIPLDYLNDNRNGEVTVVSICLYDSDGIILHVANKILNN